MSGDNGRKFVSKGVSALPEWWDKVEETAAEMGTNKSFLIRVAVDQYLKDSSADAKKTQLKLSTP